MSKVQDLASMLGVIKEINKETKATGQGWADIGQNIKGAMGAAGGGTGNMGGSGTVAQPKFNNYMPVGGNGGIGGALANAAISLPGIVASVLPSPAAAASYQLATARQSFFSGGSFGSAAALQKQMSSAGTAISSTDAVQAISALQGSGIYNTGSVAGGVAALSNYAPGLGIAGTAQASAAFQQGRATNMLNQIGVQTRGANGLSRDPNQIVNDLVEKIWSTTPALQRGGPEAIAYLTGSILPGNQLYFILQTYIPDQNMRDIVFTKLMAKAKGASATASKSELTKLGVTTGTATAMSGYNTAQLGLTQATQADINRGTTAALHLLTSATNSFAKSAERMHSILYGVGWGSTMLNSPGGAAAGALGGNLLGHALPGLLKGIGKMFTKGFNFLKGNAGKAVTALEEGNILDFSVFAAEDLAAGVMLAKGGPAQKNLPYIVGEKGPELFIPDNSGTVIPNDVTQKLMRAGGGSVDAGGFASMLLGRLGAPATAQNIANVTMWEGMEGGNWHNSAHYNPLNTSYQMGGSVNFNTGKAGGGVQAYNSWQQGLDATVGTLTGANAGARGYTAIVNGLRSGKMSKADFLKALQASSWDAGHYGGGTSSSVADSSAGGIYSSSGYSMSGGMMGAPGTVLNSSNGAMIGGSAAPIVNVTVNVPAATDAKHIAATSKAVTDAVSKALNTKTATRN